MHYFEEEYQRRFKDAESTNGVDPDQLWQEIAADLPPPQKGRRGMLLWLLLLLIGSSAGVLGYAYWGNEDQPVIQEEATAAHTTPSAESDDVQKARSTMSTEPDKSLLPEEPMSVIKPDSAKPQLTESKTIKSPSVSIAEAEGETSEVLSPDHEPTETGDQLQEDQGQSIVDEVVSAFEEEVILHQHEAVFLLHEIRPLPESKLMPTLPEVVAEKQPKSTANAAMSWGLQTGALSWHDQYADQDVEGSFGNSLSTTHRARGGYSLGVRVEVPLNEHWALTSGLDLQQVYNTFDWTRSWDTVMYRNEVPGSDLINAMGFRQVRHQNELSVLHLPIMVAYEGGQSKLRFGWQMGIGLNFMLQQEGRTLQEGGLVQGFNAANNGPYKQFFPSANLVPYLGYQLTDKTQIRLQGQARYQWHGTSEVYQLQHQSVFLGGAASVMFSW